MISISQPKLAFWERTLGNGMGLQNNLGKTLGFDRFCALYCIDIPHIHIRICMVYLYTYMLCIYIYICIHTHTYIYLRYGPLTVTVGNEGL